MNRERYNVSIRADEGTPYYIGSNTNIQDGVILHGLVDRRIQIGGKSYSVFIGKEVSVAHVALIHGPCYIADNIFVGFNAIVYNAIVGKGSFISFNAVVTNGVQIPPNRFIPPGANIDTQEKADALLPVPKDSKEFARGVQRVNQKFPASYHFLFGNNRCSCGIAFDKHLKCLGLYLLESVWLRTLSRNYGEELNFVYFGLFTLVRIVNQQGSCLRFVWAT
jgi:carbonic anhydrase/acetyltransferase-like protein (isoleucine patch superfamily)